MFSNNFLMNKGSKTSTLLSCCVMNSSGTWTCPAGTKYIQVWTIGGGGGGGAGVVSSAFCSYGSGGGGGGGGGLSYCAIETTLASSVCVCVGAGGGPGTAGGASCFVGYVCSGGGNAGASGVANCQTVSTAFSCGGTRGAGNITISPANAGYGGAGCATNFVSKATVTGEGGQNGFTAGGGAGLGKSAAYSGNSTGGGSSTCSFQGQSGGAGGGGQTTPQNGVAPGGGGAGGNSNFSPGIATTAANGAVGRVIIEAYT